MRNPKRIPELLVVLQQIWEKQPDTRFNQLVHNLQWEYANLKNAYKDTLYEKDEFKERDIISYRSKQVVDLFNVEDDQFLEFLKSKLDQ